MRESLDLDIAGAGPGDAEYRCGDIRCLTTATHDFLVQGVLIGWTQNEKERGFTVTFPNKTPENQKKTGKWIDDKLKAWRAANEQQAK
ncbi:MAG TPA: hypothetical protein VFE78_28370 [Gemmataceae bacterium]|jgi:hypothetical protein|nr:hypothetical protein [Gemmataceae bacterium]